MSSPPSSATSPTYPASISLPKKRHSLGPHGSSSLKRRKTSIASSSHPLRQTSFPPPEELSRRPSYSPTIEGSVSSVGRRGRGRPRKNPIDSRSAVAASTRSGRQGSAAADGASTVNGVGGREEDEGEDEDDEGAEDAVLEGTSMGDLTQKQERENLAMLLQAFTPEQADRYAVWRRVRLKKEIVRRITNQTLSQSVPQSVVIAINGFTKVFIGELIERAKDVQTDWLAAATTLPNGAPNTHPGVVNECDRGPLTPDHLREALRLYKKDQEGGLAGFQGLSLHGKDSIAPRSGGRRLFR